AGRGSVPIDRGRARRLADASAGPHPAEDAVHSGFGVTRADDANPDAADAALGDAASTQEPSAADLLGAALGGAARRAGLSSETGERTQAVVWSAMGGWRGILESVLPSLAFVVLFTIQPEPLVLSLGVSVGLAAVFTV